jgi:uncharacterized protein YerC
MSRYSFLPVQSIYHALNQLRHAFLAAHNGTEVDASINAILTHDERVKIGRRIQIAALLAQGNTHRQISHVLKVGLNTVTQVAKLAEQSREGYILIYQREAKTESAFRHQAYRKKGGSKKVFKSKTYTGIRRQDIPR